MFVCVISLCGIFHIKKGRETEPASPLSHTQPHRAHEGDVPGVLLALHSYPQSKKRHPVASITAKNLISLITNTNQQ